MHLTVVPSAPRACTATILVVDDEPVICTMLTQVLTKAGYIVLTAADGVQALAIARHTALDIILLDRKLPYLNGLATAKALHADPATADIPRVLMSGALLDDGSLFQAFIPKPFALDALLACIQHHQRAPVQRDDVVHPLYECAPSW